MVLTDMPHRNHLGAITDKSYQWFTEEFEKFISKKTDWEAAGETTRSDINHRVAGLSRITNYHFSLKKVDVGVTGRTVAFNYLASRS